MNYLKVSLWEYLVSFPKSEFIIQSFQITEWTFLESIEIKASLINLYDHQYKRYANMDATIESKYHNQLLPAIYKKIGYLDNVIESPDPILFKENYKELISECRNVYGVLTSNRDLLIQISKEINELLELIRIELEK